MFCTNCGCEVEEGSAFCGQCGTVLEKIATNGTPSLTLTVIRENQIFAMNPHIDIMIDNKEKYKISNGTVVKIPIEPGLHEINFSCGLRKRRLNLDMSRHTDIVVKFNRITGSIEAKIGVE